MSPRTPVRYRVRTPRLTGWVDVQGYVIVDTSPGLGMFRHFLLGRLDAWLVKVGGRMDVEGRET